MKTAFLSGLFSLLFIGSFSLLRASVEPGQKAPEASFTDLTGKAHTLADFKGRIVVLEWVNPECPFVKHHYEKTSNLPTLQKEFGAQGVAWILVNSGRPGAQGDFDAAAVKAWMGRTGAAPAAYVRDSQGTLGKLFGAKTTPHLFILSAESVVAYAGAIDDARGFDAEKTAKAVNYVRTTLAALKEGRPVVPAFTQAYGCSVKY